MLTTRLFFIVAEELLFWMWAAHSGENIFKYYKDYSNKYAFDGN